MDNEIEETSEDLTVGVMPANTQLLSNLIESDDELAKDISYLMGGVECYKDINQRTSFPFSYSNEAIAFDSGKVLARVIAYLRNMIKDLFNGSLAGSLAIESLISRAERILLDGRTVRRNHTNREFIIDTRIANLSVNYKPISDSQQLLIQLKTFNEVAKSIYNYLTYSVFIGFDSLIKFDPFTDDIDLLAATLQTSSPAVLANDVRFNNKGFSINSPQLLGCQQIVIANRNPDGAALEQILSCALSLQPSSKDPYDLPELIRYDKFSLSLEQSLVREVISAATLLSSYNTINRRATRRNRLELINTRLTEISHKVTDDLDPATTATLRNYIRILETYTGWISSPFVGLMALAQRNLTAVLNVCEGNTK